MLIDINNAHPCGEISVVLDNVPYQHARIVKAMAAILDICRLDLAQLSGSEPASIVGDPSSPLFGRCYKALKPTSLAEAEAEAEWYLPPELEAGRPGLLATVRVKR